MDKSIETAITVPVNKTETPAVPRTREMQETVNHLILGLSMWVSVTLTCITTLLAVKNAWCLFAYIVPFIYTMFPQIMRFTTTLVELGWERRREKSGKKPVKQVAVRNEVEDVA